MCMFVRSIVHAYVNSYVASCLDVRVVARRFFRADSRAFISSLSGFESLQLEQSAKRNEEKSSDFADFLQTFATRKKIMNLLSPPKARILRNVTTSRLKQTGKLRGGTNFTQVLHKASKQNKQNKQKESFAANARRRLRLMAKNQAFPIVPVTRNNIVRLSKLGR